MTQTVRRTLRRVWATLMSRHPLGSLYDPYAWAQALLWLHCMPLMH